MSVLVVVGAGRLGPGGGEGDKSGGFRRIGGAI